MKELKSKDKNYQSDWYDKNKKALSDKRKQAYKDNPELQKQARIRARQQREKMKNVKPKLETVKYKGKHYSLYSIHSVAIIVNKTNQTLKAWEAKNITPPALVVNRTRYYTVRQVELLKRYVDSVTEQKRIENNDLMFKNWSA